MRGTIPLWRGPGLYAAAVVMVEGVAWLLNPASALGPATLCADAVCRWSRCPPRSPPSARWSAGTHLFPLQLQLDLPGLVGPGVLYWRGAIWLGLAALLLLALAMLGSRCSAHRIYPSVRWWRGSLACVTSARSRVGASSALRRRSAIPFPTRACCSSHRIPRPIQRCRSPRGCACAALGVGSGPSWGRRQLAVGLYCANQLRISRSRMSRERGWPVRERF